MSWYLEGEHYWRRLSNFRGTGIAALPFDHLTDTGFQLQASAMVVPRTAQLYLSGSKIFGNYGNPSDVRFGLNVFPWKNQMVRWNTELLYLNHSPVGYLSVPFALGGNGPVFHFQPRSEFMKGSRLNDGQRRGSRTVAGGF